MRQFLFSEIRDKLFFVNRWTGSANSRATSFFSESRADFFLAKLRSDFFLAKLRSERSRSITDLAERCALHHQQIIC
jgi:hypothetical protein